VLLAVLAVACGDSPVKDTSGGLVGRMSAACNAKLAGIDRKALRAASKIGVPLQQATDRADGLVYVTEMECLEEVFDWSVAVAHLEERLAAAAATAGHSTPTVSCEAPVAWGQDFKRLGYVEEASTIIHLSPATCLGLAQLLAHPRRLACSEYSQASSHRCAPSVRVEAMALVALAHEQQHVDGESNEALAQCYAYQRAEAVGRQLGVPRRAAARIAALAKSVGAMPFAYESTECRRDHSFDLHLPGPWPLPG
jgi:hypothetical protein